MNRVMLIGRLTKDPSIMDKAETKIARYTLAVDRRTKDKQADFINCVTFGKGADFAENYLHQGMKIAVTGRIQTGSYKNRDGQKIYTTDVVVDEHEFCESPRDGAQTAYKPQEGAEQGSVDTFTTNTSSGDSRASQTPNLMDGFFGIEDNLESELPFK